MSDLSYNDFCIITRTTHETDRFDEPLADEEVYRGRCDFQPGGQTALSIVTSNDVVYLPEGRKIRPGDMIRVEPRLMEPREGSVKNAKVIEIELTGEIETEIEIIHSTEK